MLRKIVWPVLVITSIVLVIVFISGAVIAINISNSSEISRQSTDEPDVLVGGAMEGEENSTGYKILVLGDSIGYGIGDNENMGIGNRYAELIGPREDKDIIVSNLSVSGAVVSELEQSISQINPSLIAEADLIILSIGGNDLNRLQFQDSVNVDVEYQEVLSVYKMSLGKIIESLRKGNTGAQLAVVGLYDPYDNEDPSKTRLLLNWNYETRLLIQNDPKVVYIPTYEQFQYNLDRYLFIDEFHPSSVGYQVIAETLFKILEGNGR